MNRIPHIKNRIQTKVLSLCILALTGGCTQVPGRSAHTGNINTEEGCYNPSEDDERKTQLENGIRGQVKFSGVPESLSAIPDKMSEYKIPALSLALIEGGEIVWADLYQEPTLAKEENLSCYSIFQAASLSKPVTFLAALRMHAAGEIDLDDPIEKYLREYALPEGKQTTENPVTFRNIFSHTSGITAGGYMGYPRDQVFPSDLEVLSGGEGVNSQAISVVSVPNEVLAYSGGAYTLAEVALQDHFGKEFSEIMKEWILDPVGMSRSEFTQPLPESKYDLVAKGHLNSGEMVAGGWYNHPEQAAAGLWSNSVEIAKLLIEIYKGYQGQSTIFSQDDIQMMLEHERDGLAYGFIVNRTDDDIAITHYGGNTGYRTGMTISLISGNGLVYLINSDNGGALGNELLLTASQVYHWEHFKQISFQQKQVAADVLKDLAGKYRWDDQIDLTVAFDEREGRIVLYFPNGDAYALTPVEGEELDFVHPGTGVQLAFLKSDAGRSFRLYGRTAVKVE